MNAKKQARRERAAKRFVILSYDELLDNRIAKSSWGRFDRFNQMKAGQGNPEEYAAYVERKRIEAAALGL